ncbi:hypothetical protein [Rothia nasimurium]|uniref:hypothetical protein n=1 Tax=Rothia nasimurium TaxID=85336 RepID=UPI001F24653A|nr:hypothetical protein [Rothia nasimurium]
MPDAADLTYAEFCERYDSLLSGLARMGWTSSEAVHRASVLYPDIDRDLLDQAVHSGRWLFSGSQGQTHSNVLMASAIWYAVAVSFDFEPDYEYAAVGLDPTIIQDLPRMLESFAVPAEAIAGIVGRIGAALKYMAEHPYTELEEQAYDDFLAHLPQEIAHISRGDFSWPPSRALIEDRLGDRSWSKALLKVGACPPDAEGQGIKLEAGTLSERTFRNTLGEFLNYCIRYDRKPSVLLYGSWAEDPTRSGRVPHLGTVRAKYGSWHLALQAGRQMLNDAMALGGSPALPARPINQPPVDPTEPLNIQEIQAQGIGVVQPKVLTESERTARAWQQLLSVTKQRLDELPWTLSLRIYYLSPEIVETEDVTNFVSIFRSPAGYFCELTSPDEFEAIEVELDTEMLEKAGWTAPAPGGRWARNFLSVSDAAEGVIEAMHRGMGCDHPDYYQSDDPTGSLSVNTAHPSTGSIPMVPVTGSGFISIDDF